MCDAHSVLSAIQCRHSHTTCRYGPIVFMQGHSKAQDAASTLALARRTLVVGRWYPANDDGIQPIHSTTSALAHRGSVCVLCWKTSPPPIRLLFSSLHRNFSVARPHPAVSLLISRYFVGAPFFTLLTPSRCEILHGAGF